MSESHRRLIFGTLILGAVLALTLALYQLLSMEIVHQWISEAFEFLRGHLLALFFAIVVLPGIGFPMTPLYLIAGPTFMSSFSLVASCAIILCASTLNMVWTYFVASSILHRFVERILDRLDYKLPRVRDHDQIHLIMIMRVTPGIPLVVQNYLLGLGRVRFGAYLPISVFVQSGYLIGFVVTSGAIYEGNTGLVIAGVCALFAAVLFTNLIRKRLGTES